MRISPLIFALVLVGCATRYPLGPPPLISDQDFTALETSEWNRKTDLQRVCDDGDKVACDELDE